MTNVPAPVQTNRGPQFSAARALTVVTPLVFAAALVGALSGREPWHTWFYSIAWWSLLLFLDAAVYRRRKESLFLSHPHRFFFFAGFSVVLWFLFEALNLRLGNWTYQGLPAERPARWAGYILAFATVVPAVMESADFLETCGWPFRGTGSPPRARLPGAAISAAGALMLAAALAWPTLFFPFVWIAFALLVDPLNDRLGAPSLLRDWREGSTRRLKLLLSAGLLCGLLWEALNMPAGARWVYYLPGLDRMKVFEMPLPGYLGFPLFAVEVFALSSLALTLWDRSSKAFKAAVVLADAGFVWILCGLVDRFTAGFPS